jgi:hypothetical protein
MPQNACTRQNLATRPYIGLFLASFEREKRERESREQSILARGGGYGAVQAF